MQFSAKVRDGLVRLWKLEGSPTFRYLLPFVAILMALLTHAAITPLVSKSKDFPFALFYLVAVIAAAWWGGYGPGVLACLLVLVGLPLAAIPNFRLAHLDWSRLVLMAGVSFAISAVAHAQRRSREALRRANQDLDQRVQMRTQDLAEAVEHLRESEQRVDLALDAAGIGRWDLDLTTRKASRSLRHDQIFGHEELLPEWTWDLFFEHIRSRGSGCGRGKVSSGPGGHR